MNFRPFRFGVPKSPATNSLNTDILQNVMTFDFSSSNNYIYPRNVYHGLFTTAIT